MSTKYNTRHPDRGRSNYKLRLEKRGLSKAPSLEPVGRLRDRQLRREEQTGSPWPSAREDEAAVSDAA